MTTLEQAVSQIQQELLTIRVQVVSRVQMSESVQATDNLTTQSHEDAHTKASSCINTNAVGRLNEFSRKEEDSQHRSEDIKAFFGRLDDGNHDNSDRSRVLADGVEWRSRSTQPGVCLAAYA